MLGTIAVITFSLHGFVNIVLLIDPKGDPHVICQRWKKWKRSFKLYLTGKGVTDDAQKRALLLHAAGVDVQIYFTLVIDWDKL